MIPRGIQYSFAAGSMSLDPHGYRIIDGQAPNRISDIVRVFPEMRRYSNPSTMIVTAYPATLGPMGQGPFVDTYLHPPTFIRAMRLAACERRSVIFLSQPLLGADLYFKLCESGMELPHEMVWAVGGYYLPRSLENAIRERLGALGCQLMCLHAYGVAEIGHSCFVATKRFESGVPRYIQVAKEVKAEIVGEGNLLKLSNENSRSVLTTDTARRVGDEWMIESGVDRLAPCVRELLESWTPSDWQHRTGYLYADGDQVILQQREHVTVTPGISELSYFEYLARFGGSFSCKPKWNVRPVLPNYAAESSSR